MSESQKPPVGKLEQYEQPVLHTSSNSGHIWHIPVIRDGKAEFACASNHSFKIMVSSLAVFKRRRNYRMCLSCQQRTSANGYPDDAPWQEEQ